MTDGLDPIEPHGGLTPTRAGWNQRLRSLLIDVSPLRESRQFRLLWLGTAVSYMGSQITFIAVPIQVYRLTGSALAVGLVGLFELIPLLALSLIGGAVADAMDRRRLLTITDIGLALCSGLLIVNSALERPHVWLIYVLVAIAAGLYALGQPALRSSAPMLLPKESLPAAASLASIYHSLGAVIGPLLAGILVAAVGFRWTYGIDVASYAVSLVALRAMRPIPPVATDQRITRRSVLDGVRYLRGRPVLQGSFIVDIIAMVFGMPNALFPAIASEFFGGGASVVGMMYAAPPAGAFLASLSSGWAGRVRRQGLAVYVAVLLWGGALIAFGVARSLWIALLALAIAGAADMVSAIFRTTILQTSTPEHLVGRLTGVELAVVATGPSLGDLEAGVVASLTSLRVSVVSGGLLCILGVGVMAILLPSFHRYDARAATSSDRKPGSA